MIREKICLEFKSLDDISHLKIYEKFTDLMETQVVSDVLPKQYNFDTPFNAIISDRSEWFNVNLQMNSEDFVYFTDGSKKDNSVGAGVYGPSCRISKALGSAATVFQAEVHAIEICVDKCRRRNDIQNRKVYIASDSQAAIKALMSNQVTSKQILDYLNNLKTLAWICNLTLIWVPGHEEIDGNEKADELARKGSETRFIGPEPFCGYGLSNFKLKL